MERRSALTGCWRMSAPSSRIRPLLGSTIRLIIRSVVVFPQPDGPTRTVIEPSGMSSDSSSTATVPSGYLLVTDSMRIKTGSPPGLGCCGLASGAITQADRAGEFRPPMLRPVIAAGADISQHRPDRGAEDALQVGGDGLGVDEEAEFVDDRALAADDGEADRGVSLVGAEAALDLGDVAGGDPGLREGQHDGGLAAAQFGAGDVHRLEL